jgi:hypothetical protein
MNKIGNVLNTNGRPSKSFNGDHMKKIIKLLKRIYGYPEMTYKSVPWRGDMFIELEDQYSDQGITVWNLFGLKSYDVMDVLSELDHHMKQYKHMKTEQAADEWSMSYTEIESRFIEIASEEIKGEKK